jgi:hypothetical protein
MTAVRPDTEAPAESPGRALRRPPRWAVAVLLVAVLAAAVIAIAAGGGRSSADGPGPAGAAATTAPAAGEPSSSLPPPPSVPPADPDAPPVGADEPPPSLPAAPLDAPVDVEQATVRLVSVEQVAAEARGRGSIAGPALRVTVRIENGTPALLTLDDVSVTLASGPDSAPASPVDDPSAAPFAGPLEVGAQGEGVYVFQVPEDQRGAVTVSVAVRPGAPVATFAGAVG